MNTLFKKGAIVALAVAGLMAVDAKAQVFTENFDNDSAFTTSTGFFSDGGSDYFGLTGGTEDFGAGASPTGIPGFSGATGSYLVGEDLDGEGATLPITITWSGINIAGETGLSFSGDFGSSTGGIDLASDELLLEYQIDSGGFSTLLDFDFLPDGDNFNSTFTLAGGTSPADDLGLTLKTFNAAIAGTGSTLDLRLTVSVNSGSEEFAVDNFSVTAIPEPSTFTLLALGLGGLLFARRRQK